MPDGLPTAIAHQIGKHFANAQGHEHTGITIEGIDTPSTIRPDVPPLMGPTLPSDDIYAKYRTSQT